MTENNFNAKNFVKELLNEGDRVFCDDTIQSFNKDETLPVFYNEEKFKRAQKFYHQNILAMFFAKILGLVSSLALPKVNAILRLTNKTSEPKTAYRRYLSTIFHMKIWYDDEFQPGSKLWKSITAVKFKHNSASKKGCAAGIGKLTQMDMALAQFGFMGFVITKKDLVGVHGTDEDMEAFVHLWRVIGYNFGLEDKFNICRENLQETKEICEILLEEVFKPNILKFDTNFIKMATALIDGMWCMMPLLETNVFLSYILKVLGTDYNKEIQLSFFRKFHFWFVCYTIYILRFSLIRIYHNWNIYLGLWLMETFPFLAYYKFGYENSHVYIFQSNKI